MDMNKLNDAVKVLRKELGEALLSTSIWSTGVGTPIAGFNEHPEATALFDRATSYLSKTLENSGFPELDEYYLLELKNGKTIIIQIFPEGFQWGILADKEKLNLGLLLGVALPQARKMFYQALED